MIDQYIEHIVSEEGLKKNTTSSYRYDLEGFQAYLKEISVTAPAQIKRAHIVSYLLYLRRIGRATTTILRCAASIKGYCKYLVKNGLISENPCEGLKLPKNEQKTVKAPTSVDVISLMDQISQQSVKGIRDRAMIDLVARTGMRASEMTALNLSDYMADKALISLKTEKGELFFPLSPETKSMLDRYLKDSRPTMCRNAETALFVNMAGQRITRQGFWKIVRQYHQRTGSTIPITPRTLRYTLLG